MSAPGFARTAIAFSLLLVVSACGGDSTTTCDASNCLGCCQSDGVCAPGDQALACGSGGAACGGCGSLEQCVAGVCKLASCRDTCQEGAARCEAGKRAECVRGADGCLAFAAAQACQGGLVCSGGACVERCSDQCTQGQARCDGAGVQTCERQMTGCTEWGATTSCGAGVCRNGQCSTDSCTDTCTAGAQRCASDRRQETCQLVQGGCLDWVGKDCTASESCTQERCVATSPCSPPCPNGFTCSSALVCEGGSLTSLILNTDMVTVNGHLTVNGAIPTYDSSYCSYPSRELARLTFQHKASGAEFVASVRCNHNGFNFSTRVAPGTYDVFVEPYSSNDANLRMAPLRMRAASNVDIHADQPDLKINELVYPVSGKLTVNGSVPTLANTAACANAPGTHLVDISLSRVTTPAGEGSLASVYINCAQSSQFTFETLLPAGEYKPTIKPAFGSGTVGPRILPGSMNMTPNLVVSGPVSNVVYNQVAHAVSGKITVNGATPTLKSGTCTSSLRVARLVASSEDLRFLGSIDVPCTADFSFSTLLPPGRHSVYVHDGGDYGPPVSNLSPVGVKQSLNVTGALSNVLFNEVVYPVSGKLTVNGAAPILKNPCRSTDRMAILTFDPADGFDGTVTLSCSDNFLFSTVLPANAYGISARPFDSETTNLANGSYAFSQLTVSGAMSNVVLNEVMHPVSGRITLNGGTPTGHEAYCGLNENKTSKLAEVLFDNAIISGTDASASITCQKPDFSFSTLVPAGSFKVETRKGFYADSSSTNFVHGTYPDLTVSGPVTNLVLDRVVRTVSGRLTVNNLAPTLDASYCANSSSQNSTLANISFKDVSSSFVQTASVRCKDPSFSFTAFLPPGTYDVRVYKANEGAGLNFTDGFAQVVAKLRVP
ncbi:hypothetical protein [Hyalangium gracile]|uniref:hypothetical protein n=1 Tax=Hyalangium gracile TaxID=394092 RepID=UPI001CCC302E|nr:hypothetical protein [Hyalangium gracile]